jgi:hypothetical protein
LNLPAYQFCKGLGSARMKMVLVPYYAANAFCSRHNIATIRLHSKWMCQRKKWWTCWPKGRSYNYNHSDWQSSSERGNSNDRRNRITTDNADNNGTDNAILVTPQENDCMRRMRNNTCTKYWMSYRICSMEWTWDPK